MSGFSYRVVVLVLTLPLASCGRSRGSSVTPTSPSSLPQRFPLVGTVTGFQDAGLAGAVLEIVDGADRGLRVTTDASGRYRFDAVQTGTITLQATAEGYVPASTPVTVNQALTVSLRLVVIPADFLPIESHVVALIGKPAGTYGGSVVSSGAGCAERLTATGEFLDRTSSLIRTLTWSADPAQVFKPGDHVAYEFCCILAAEADQVADVRLNMAWLNRPCS